MISSYKLFLVHEVQQDIEEQLTTFVNTLNKYEFLKAERILSEEAFQKKIDSRLTGTNLFLICSNFITDSVITCINEKKARVTKAQGLIIYKPDGIFLVDN